MNIQNVGACEHKKVSIKQTKGLNKIELIFILFVISYFVLPVVNSKIPFIIALGIFLLYGFYLMLTGEKEGELCCFLLISVGIFALMYFLLVDSSTISENVTNYGLKRFLSKYNQIYTIFIPAIVYLRIKRLASNKQKKYLINIAILLFAYVFINTMIELLVNPRASRDWSQFGEQMDANVGTYAFVYAVALITAVMPIYLFDQTISKKILAIFCIVMIFLFLFLAQYTLAVIIAIVGMVIQIIRIVKKQVVKLLIFLSLVLVLFFIPSILTFLAESVSSEDISIRLKELASFFSSGSTEGYNLNGRLSLYGQTIEAFLKSPFWGNRRLGFDGHATFLTVFADIGLFGGGLFICMYYKTKKALNKGQSKKQNKIFSTIFFCYVLMGLTNPIHFAQPLSATMWLIIPMMIDRTKEVKK